MEIKIVNYVKESKGLKIGSVDFKIIYSATKDQEFNNVGHFQKENKEWLSIQNFKRGDKWLPSFNQTGLRALLADVLKVLKDHLVMNPPTTFEQEIGW